MSGVVSGDYDWLRGVESPFSWRPSDLMPAHERSALLRHLEHQDQELTKKHNPPRFTFTNFVVRLLLGYELYATGNNINSSMLMLDELERELNRLDIISNNSFYRETRRAKWHVVLGTRAGLLARTGELDESKKVVGQNFDPVSSLTTVEVAALHGIKSRCFLEYRARGSDQALHWARQAIQENPHQPEWHFLAGRAMETIRKASSNFSVMPKEEFAYFEKAVSLSPKPDHALYLGQVYEDIVKAILSQHTQDKEFKTSPLYKEIGEVSRRTSQLYKNIIRSNLNSTKTLVRCLKGLLKLPRQYLDEDELKALVLRLDSLPNKTNEFYNVAATYYLKIERDSRTALQFLEKGAILGDYKSCVSELRLRVKLRHDIDAESHLLKLVEMFKEDKKSHEGMLAYLGSFYLFKNHNLRAAIEVFNRILRVNPRSKALIVHEPIFVRSVEPINLLLVAVNQVRVADVVPLVVPVIGRPRAMFLGIIHRFHRDMLDREIDVDMMDRINDASSSLDPVHRRRMKKRGLDHME